MNSVIEEVAAERQRQIEVEGWSAEHDDKHINNELAHAAACFAVGETIDVSLQRLAHVSCGCRDLAGCYHFGGLRQQWVWLWPWAKEWWKPKDRRRDLIRAAALIVAEIERLDRAPVRGDHV